MVHLLALVPPVHVSGMLQQHGDNRWQRGSDGVKERWRQDRRTVVQWGVEPVPDVRQILQQLLKLLDVHLLGGEQLSQRVASLQRWRAACVSRGGAPLLHGQLQVSPCAARLAHAALLRDGLGLGAKLHLITLHAEQQRCRPLDPWVLCRAPAGRGLGGARRRCTGRRAEEHLPVECHDDLLPHRHASPQTGRTQPLLQVRRQAFGAPGDREQLGLRGHLGLLPHVLLGASEVGPLAEAPGAPRLRPLVVQRQGPRQLLHGPHLLAGKREHCPRGVLLLTVPRLGVDRRGLAAATPVWDLTDHL
mmetsp:Transcript_62066/g.172015  ORF Transcript_62066/g.172015 Transcript_62066/m.172015 type:complete len:304 (-) Transcript_62066:335-1246(-)